MVQIVNMIGCHAILEANLPEKIVGGSVVEFYPLSRKNQNTCLTNMSLSHRCPMAPEKMPLPRCVSMHQENHWNVYC